MSDIVYSGKTFTICKSTTKYAICDICLEKIRAGKAFVRISTASIRRYVNICIPCFRKMIDEFNNLKNNYKWRQ